MMISGVALYFYTKILLEKEIEEELYSNKARIERILAKEGEFIDFESILQVKKVQHQEAEQLQDTLIYDPSQNEIELFRQLSGTKIINGTNYKITVRAMIIESEDILYAIVFTFFTIIFLAFIFLFYLNKSRNEKLWKPFFTNLTKIKNFSVRSDKPLQFVDSEVLEFHELHKELKILTSKIQTDYKNLKQFTEDVSHEMQTPLAIMQAKIDTVINDGEINETQFQQFSSLQSDISRLKQLNKKLILLAKIENDQFTTNEV
ncbi:MAG: two-component sensor histidine kinase, partial [Mesonia sp.]|nr:two-component sensor histidine kinase [Mesonia sp.]